MSDKNPEAETAPAAFPLPSPGLSSVQRRRKRIIFVVALLLLFAALFTQSWWGPEGFWHEDIEVVGMVLIGLCVLGRTWCSLYIGGHKSATIIRTGPYAVVRNPLYVFSVVAAGATGLLAGSIVVGALFALLIFLIFNGVIRKEETFLLKKFDGPYRDYLATTPRWLPNWRLWKDADTLVVRPNLVWMTFRDASLFYLAYPLFEGIEWLQATGILPVYLWLP
ncbi:MAG: isoprenylcysteine carboxyl methyltransferase [Rhodospirillaceae bacterium]|nr:MAG: isoprenylcysteine carboxyl methyltransferase [Rhodospirillaceae bacterium]